MARDPYKYFRIEARQLIDQLGQGVLEVEKTGAESDVVARLLRLAHTLKGASRVVRQPEIADEAHALEDVLTPLRDSGAPVTPETISALLGLLDGIAGRVGALAAPAATEPSTTPVEPGRADAPAADEGIRAAGMSEDNLEGLIEDIGEAHAQLMGLRRAAHLAATAERTAGQLADAMRAGPATDGAARASWLVMVRELAAAAASVSQGIGDAHARIEREIRQVREAVEQLRLAPARAMFPALERIGRDSALVLGKTLIFEATGGDVRVEAGALRLAQDALTQMVRNAVAHGIETPSDRLSAGKPTQGRVTIGVERRGRKLVFRCADDGRGIDAAKLAEAATARDGSGRHAATADASLASLLLRAGVSTSPVVTEVSGRGIGMDIVRDAMERLGGTFGVETTPGQGTTLELIMPESVASIEGLHVESESLSATIPLSAVRHALRVAPADIHHTSLGEAIVYEGRSIPLLPLAQILGQPLPRRESGMSAVVVRANMSFAAIAVTRIRGVGVVVTRTLPDLAPVSAAVSGASIGADGRPLLLLDPEAIAAAAYRGSASLAAVMETKKPVLVIDDSLTTRMLEQSILESAGYEVDLATSAEEGLEQVRKRPYALILCDVEMPGMDGFGFVETIRRDPQLRDTPAILVTSRNGQEDRRRGAEVGAQGYVVKSEFDQDALLDHIRQLVA